MEAAPDHYVESIGELIEPVLRDMDFELVDIEYLSERGRWVLRIFVDRQDPVAQGGITLDDCVMLSRELGILIDVKDVFDHEYVLEVSSPGLNRPLKKDKDFLWAVGKRIEVQMAHPIDGRKKFSGGLRKFENRTLCLEMDEGLVSLDCADVKKARLLYEFES